LKGVVGLEDLLEHGGRDLATAAAALGELRESDFFLHGIKVKEDAVRYMKRLKKSCQRLDEPEQNACPVRFVGAGKMQSLVN